MPSHGAAGDREIGQIADHQLSVAPTRDAVARCAARRVDVGALAGDEAVDDADAVAARAAALRPDASR